MKSYTNIEQSKILAEILPIESADMHYLTYSMYEEYCDEIVYTANLGKPGMYDKCCIPCWSLAALLNVIPQEIFDGEYVINITEGLDNKWVLTYDHHENRHHSYYGLSTGADNLVDACVAMIEKLHEQKLL